MLTRQSAGNEALTWALIARKLHKGPVHALHVICPLLYISNNHQNRTKFKIEVRYPSVVQLLFISLVLFSVKYRLEDGPYRYSGRVGVFYNGEWGTVCDDNFEQKDAEVLCHSLGYR